MAKHNRALLCGGVIGAVAPIAPLTERGSGVRSEMEIWSEIRRDVLTGALSKRDGIVAGHGSVATGAMIGN
jgi:hypothetical protein